MAGAAMSSQPVNTGRVLDVGAHHALSQSSMQNSVRVAVAGERLAQARTAQRIDPVEFINLCLHLARGIDYGVAHNEVPATVKQLPLLIKQVCELRSDVCKKAAITVLLISVKNACKIGWFPDRDSEELLKLADEMGSGFCTLGDISSQASSYLPIISNVMSRYYPQLKMGRIIAFLEAKPGYGAFMVDFPISKNTMTSPQEKIRLFVAQSDNVNTSSCIISPQQVNILLNGKGVERRTNVTMDTGPQLPTNVTPMLKFGTNLLQAVGQFNGNYIMFLAFTSVTPTPDTPQLQAYVQPVVSSLESDSDITEGASRISLNCPISRRRINTPVKGHSCKHLQCFDFHNYIEINSRRPYWRCPHCNQHVSYTDIRIDQNMVKVLREVREDVADVMVSIDGSWKAVKESNSHSDHPDDIITPSEGPPQRERTNFSNTLSNILDLTDIDDEIEVAPQESEDRKPDLQNLNQNENLSIPINLPEPPDSNRSLEANQNQSTASHLEDDFWAGIFLPSLGPEASSCTTPTTVISDDFRGTNNSNSQLSIPNNMQLQQTQFVQSLINNEYGRLQTIPRHVTRTPIAIQALPAQPATSSTQQRPRTGLGLAGFDMERQQQQLSRSLSSSLHHHSRSQSWDGQDLGSFASQQPAHQVVGLPAPNIATPYRVPSVSTSQQPFTQRMPQIVNQTPSLIRTPHAHFPRVQAQPSGAPTISAAYRTAQATRQRQQQSPLSLPVQNQSPRAVSCTEDLIDLPSEQNWRPTGRMRGSLSGQAYSAALSQFMSPPVQPVQPARPSLGLASASSDVPVQLHMLINGNGSSTLRPQTLNYPMTPPVSRSGSGPAMQ